MSLDALRDEIDTINEQIVEDIAARMDMVERIKEHKEDAGRAVRDPGREEDVRDQFADLFAAEGLPPERGRELADLLIEIAVEAQR